MYKNESLLCVIKDQMVFVRDYMEIRFVRRYYNRKNGA